MAEALPHFPLFDADPSAGDIAVCWDIWVRCFENLLTAINGQCCLLEQAVETGRHRTPEATEQRCTVLEYRIS